MLRWTQAVGRTNAVFLSLFGLLFAGLIGVNLYKNVRYSTFILTVKPVASVSESPDGFVPSKGLAPVSRTTGAATYTGLHAYWWADRAIYRVGTPDHGLWVRVKPTIRGSYTLVPGNEGSRTANVIPQVIDTNGDAVPQLQPGRWYQVRQYGQPVEIRIDR